MAPLLPGNLGRHAGMTRQERTRDLAHLARAAKQLPRGDLGHFEGKDRTQRLAFLQGLARRARRESSPGPLLYARTLANHMHAKKMAERLGARGGTSRWHRAALKGLVQKQQAVAEVLERMRAARRRR